MRDTELFQAALGLSSPWIVLRSEFDPDQKQLDLHIGFARGSRFACPACGAEGCGVHDVREKEWRHLNFFQHKTVLKASIPRVSCDKCGVKQVSPPWARTGSGFTLLFEAFLLSMVKAMPVANVAEIVDEHDTRLWRVLDHYVSRAVEGLDLSEVEQIAAVFQSYSERRARGSSHVRSISALLFRLQRIESPFFVVVLAISAIAT